MLGDLFSRLGRFVWLFEWLGGLDGLGGFGLLIGGNSWVGRIVICFVFLCVCWVRFVQ